MDKVKQFIKENIKENSTVVVACSGGPDSMCLLSLLCSLKSGLNLKIIVAHVNHKLRVESDEEEVLVKSFAEENNCLFEVIHLDEFKTEKFSEDIARRKRYNFFDSIMNKYNGDYLLTAHHGDDLVETILMRLTRGSNLNGYIGFKKINNNILRPLVYVTKEDILKYNEDNNIKYAFDLTNESLDYTRNRYRHVMLPFLKKEEENIHLKYLQYSEELDEYNNFVNEYVLKNKYIVDNKIVINNIKEESIFIKRKAIELLVKEVQKVDIFDINNRHNEDILNLLNSNGNKSIDLNNGYKCIKEYDYLYINKYIQEEEFKYVLDKDIEVNGYKFLTTLKDVGDSNYEVRLNSEDIKLPLIIRNRCNGDKIEVKNLNGSKKIKDIFIDEKINNSIRRMIPIVTDSDNKIIWIPGVKKSKFAKDKNEKYDIILKCEVD